MHSYHALTNVCVGSCMCCSQATPLSKLQDHVNLGLLHSYYKGGGFPKIHNSSFISGDELMICMHVCACTCEHTCSDSLTLATVCRESVESEIRTKTQP